VFKFGLVLILRCSSWLRYQIGVVFDFDFDLDTKKKVLLLLLLCLKLFKKGWWSRHTTTTLFGGVFSREHERESSAR